MKKREHFLSDSPAGMCGRYKRPLCAAPYLLNEEVQLLSHRPAGIAVCVGAGFRALDGAEVGVH